MVAVKKQIQGEGITAFEQDPRYKKVTQCRTNIDEIFDEEKCRNLNKKPSYNSYSTYNSSSFFGTHRYDPNLEINKRTELNIMNALKGKFSYPYTGLRLQHDPKDIHSYPRFTVNRFVLEMLRNNIHKYDNIHKYEITDRCVKKFIKIYETDAENAAKQAAKDAEKAAKDAEKAAKDAEKAAKDAEKAAKDAEKAAKEAEEAAKEAEEAAKEVGEEAKEVGEEAEKSHTIALIMSELEKKFSYPYTGLRLQHDPKDIHSYPRFTVNRFVLEMVRNNIHKYEIAQRCVKKFIKIYETDAENAAKQAAKQAAKEAEEAAKEVREEAEKSHTIALIMSELEKKFSYPYTGLRSISDSHDLKVFPRHTAYAYFLNFFKNEPDKHTIVIHSCVKMFQIVYERRAAEKAMNERLKEREKEREKEEKAAAKAAAKAAKKTQKTKPKQNKTKKTPPKEPSPKIPSPNPNEKRKRCPNGTRRNKKTGDCEKYN